MENKEIKRKVLIGTPAYGGQCYTKFTESLLYTKELLEKNNIDFEVMFINNQLVTRARNMIASTFMNGESYTHLLFIDADVTWNPVNVLMLLEHELECVIGVYPNKQYYKRDGNITVNPSSTIQQPIVENGNLIKVKHGATGFMLLTKAALKRVEKDVDTFMLPNGNDWIELYNYFDCAVVDKNYLTEDYYFSHLFTKNGGEMWADKRIQLLHIGTHNYGELC